MENQQTETILGDVVPTVRLTQCPVHGWDVTVNDLDGSFDFLDEQRPGMADISLIIPFIEASIGHAIFEIQVGNYVFRMLPS